MKDKKKIHRHADINQWFCVKMQSTRAFITSAQEKKILTLGAVYKECIRAANYVQKFGKFLIYI